MEVGVDNVIHTGGISNQLDYLFQRIHEHRKLKYE